MLLSISWKIINLCCCVHPQDLFMSVEDVDVIPPTGSLKNPVTNRVFISYMMFCRPGVDLDMFRSWSKEMQLLRSMMKSRHSDLITMQRCRNPKLLAWLFPRKMRAFMWISSVLRSKWWSFKAKSKFSCLWKNNWYVTCDYHCEV